MTAEVFQNTSKKSIEISNSVVSINIENDLGE